MKPTLTVVIPTRQRSDTLRHTLRTCLSQDCDRLRVLVSDNYSSDDTSDVVHEFSDRRLVYINTGRRIDMASNWEFALEHVDSDFVTFLGDDDGLLPGALGVFEKILKDSAVAAVAWRKGEYCWPDHIVPVYKNFFHLPLDTRVTAERGLASLERVRSFNSSYSELPSVYNAFVRTSLIRELKARQQGRFFNGYAPDVYSAVVLAAHCSDYIYSRIPLALNGASRHSTGTATMHSKRDSASSRAFEQEMRESNHQDTHPIAPSVELVVADALRSASLALPDASPLFEVPDETIIAAAYRGASTRGDEIQATVIAELRRRASHGAGLSTLEALLRNDPMPTNPPISIVYGYSEMGPSLTLDASLFGVTNVFDAARLAGHILSNSFESIQITPAAPSDGPRSGNSPKQGRRRFLARFFWGASP